MSGAQSFRAGSTESPATSETIQVPLQMYPIQSVCNGLVVCGPPGAFQPTFNTLFSQPRKTPVQIFYSSKLDRRLQSVGPTKGPPVLSQLPPGFHHLYSQIEYDCASPYYQHYGSSRRTCLKTGKWSGRHVSCSPGEGSRAPEHQHHLREVARGHVTCSQHTLCGSSLMFMKYKLCLSKTWAELGLQ